MTEMNISESKWRTNFFWSLHALSYKTPSFSVLERKCLEYNFDNITICHERLYMSHFHYRCTHFICLIICGISACGCYVNLTKYECRWLDRKSSITFKFNTVKRIRLELVLTCSCFLLCYIPASQKDKI
jgi:hypothetical protein